MDKLPDQPFYDPLTEELQLQETRRDRIMESIIDALERDDPIVGAAVLLNLRGRREGWREIEESAHQLAEGIERGKLPYLDQHPWPAEAMIIEIDPLADYLAAPGMSKSKLWPMAQSPAHFLAAQLRPPIEPSPAMKLGTLVHAAVLEPDRFEDRYCVDLSPAMPVCDRRTKAGKAAHAAWVEVYNAYHATVGEGREMISPADFAKATQMAEAVRSHPTLARLFDGKAVTELSLFWTDTETQIPCKARIDLWHPDLRIALDLKTTADASNDALPRSMAKFGYHLQDAHYCEGIRQCLDSDFTGPMLFAFVESVPLATGYDQSDTYPVALTTLGQASRDYAERQRARLMRLVDTCAKRSVWPAYPDSVQEVELPIWVLRSEEG